MQDVEIKTTRQFIHAISNDLSISFGNINILQKKREMAGGKLEEEELEKRISKIYAGLEASLEKIDEYRKWHAKKY